MHSFAHRAANYKWPLVHAANAIRQTGHALLIAVALQVCVQSVVAQETVESQEATVPEPQLATPPSALQITAAAPMPLLNRKQQLLGEHHRPTPIEMPPPGVAPAADVDAENPSDVIIPGVTPLDTPPQVRLLMNRDLKDVETSDSTSTVCEPSLAVRGNEILYTGNWFAAFSNDGGVTFKFRNPGNLFPEIPGQPFCCDQVALYDPEHDAMYWFLQYVHDDNGNTVRVAVATGDDIKNEKWRFYNFTPQGVNPDWEKEWFDYPDLTLGDKFLYVSTNAFEVEGGFTRSVVLRLPRKELSEYESFSYNYLSQTDVGSLRVAQGSGDTAYIGTHKSLSSLRVFSWPENSASANTKEVSVDPWSNNTRVALPPDGNNWLGRADGRVTAAWANADAIGFAWSSAQSGDFTFPHIRVVLLKPDSLERVAQPHIWSPNFAFAYPAAAPNSDGVIGISLQYGGGSTLFPSQAVGVLQKPATGSSNWSWQLITAKQGTNGPVDGKWGDYLAVRPHGEHRQSWVATGFTLQAGAGRDSIVPSYIHFSID